MYVRKLAKYMEVNSGRTFEGHTVKLRPLPRSNNANFGLASNSPPHSDRNIHIHHFKSEMSPSSHHDNHGARGHVLHQTGIEGLLRQLTVVLSKEPLGHLLHTTRTQTVNPALGRRRHERREIARAADYVPAAFSGPPAWSPSAQNAGWSAPRDDAGRRRVWQQWEFAPSHRRGLLAHWTPSKSIYRIHFAQVNLFAIFTENCKKKNLIKLN